MTREFRLVRAGKCPTSSMGGGSLALFLEPRCSKFRGELTSLQTVCSLEPESLGVKPSPTWGASPFIVQGGPPVYIYLSRCPSSARGTFIFVSRRAPLGRSGVKRLVLDWFSWATGCQAIVPSWSVGVASVLSRGSAIVFSPVRPYGFSRPHWRCMSFPLWLLTGGWHTR